MTEGISDRISERFGAAFKLLLLRGYESSRDKSPNSWQMSALPDHGDYRTALDLLKAEGLVSVMEGKHLFREGYRITEKGKKFYDAHYNGGQPLPHLPPRCD